MLFGKRTVLTLLAVMILILAACASQAGEVPVTGGTDAPGEPTALPVLPRKPC
jgi:outer membrane biogenesis lipoprotein LolB